MMGKDFENTYGHKTPKGETKMMSAVLDGAVFPGTQGDPRTRNCCKSSSLCRSHRPKFETYTKQVVANARALSQSNDRQEDLTL